MLRTDEILSTVQMLQQEHLDVRSVTLGINLLDCASPSLDHLCRKIHERIRSRAEGLVSTCRRISARYGIPIVNCRIAVSPIAVVAAGHGVQGLVEVAHTLDQAAEEVSVDFLGGYTALVHKGMNRSDRALIESIPIALSETTHVCASINAASSHAGINMEAVALLGRIIKELAERTADRDGFGCA
ncbi:MAG: DUF711 family protein, partial [Armatimonadota bacterium]